MPEPSIEQNGNQGKGYDSIARAFYMTEKAGEPYLIEFERKEKGWVILGIPLGNLKGEVKDFLPIPNRKNMLGAGVDLATAAGMWEAYCGKEDPYNTAYTLRLMAMEQREEQK